MLSLSLTFNLSTSFPKFSFTFCRFSFSTSFSAKLSCRQSNRARSSSLKGGGGEFKRDGRGSKSDFLARAQLLCHGTRFSLELLYTKLIKMYICFEFLYVKLIKIYICFQFLYIKLIKKYIYALKFFISSL